MAGAVRTVSQTTQVTAHSGPLPAVEDFAGYERVVPGAGDRILTMAERQQDGRLEHNRAQAEKDNQHREQVLQAQERAHKRVIVSDYLGQVFGFVLALVSLCFGAYAGIEKENWIVAGLFLSLPVVGMIKAVRGMKDSAAINSPKTPE